MGGTSAGDFDLKAKFAEYMDGLGTLIDTNNAIALGQYYYFNNSIINEHIFAGVVVLIAGRLKAGSLPAFLGQIPEKVEYPRLSS